MTRMDGDYLFTNTDTFPHRLQKLREKQKMNRKMLAEMCGLSKNMIARYERGEVEPTASSIIAIAEFFNVSTDYLLFGRKYYGEK